MDKHSNRDIDDHCFATAIAQILTEACVFGIVGGAIYYFFLSIYVEKVKHRMPSWKTLCCCFAYIPCISTCYAKAYKNVKTEEDIELKGGLTKTPEEDSWDFKKDY